jgi:copper chaperone CopZ
MCNRLAIVLSLICLSTIASAGEHQVVEIEVTGLACPFCAYSVEKSIMKLQGVDRVQVDLAKGQVCIEMQAEQTADLDQVRKAIVNAGFTPGEVTTSTVDK